MGLIEEFQATVYYQRQAPIFVVSSPCPGLADALEAVSPVHYSLSPVVVPFTHLIQPQTRTIIAAGVPVHYSM